MIINENNQIQKEMKQFLNTIIYENLNQQEWTYFVIEILNEFLGSDEQCQHHHKVIQGLDKMYIPTLELLIYLVQTLNRNQNNRIVLTFTLLNLLINSLGANIIPKPNKNHIQNNPCRFIQTILQKSTHRPTI